MAMRSKAISIWGSSVAVMEGGGIPRFSVLPRYFSGDGKVGGGSGRVLSEEERAKETVYIQKMERERLEKSKLKSEKEKAEKDKEPIDKKSK